MYVHPHDLYALAQNEETTDVVCPSCKKTYYVQGGYHPFYECSKVDPN